MLKLTKKQQEEIQIEIEVERRVKEKLRRREGEAEYNRIYYGNIARGLCGRCGSRQCVCKFRPISPI